MVRTLHPDQKCFVTVFSLTSKLTGSSMAVFRRQSITFLFLDGIDLVKDFNYGWKFVNYNVNNKNFKLFSSVLPFLIRETDLLSSLDWVVRKDGIKNLV